MKLTRSCRDTCLCLVAVASAMPASADYLISQESSNGYASAPTVGQSFTTTDAGMLEQIDVFVSLNAETDTVTLRVYAGNTSPGDPAQAICQETFTGVPTTADQWYSFVVTEGACRIALSAATQYTFELDGPHNPATRLQTGDPLAGGIFFTEFPLTWPDRDMAFRVHLTSPVPVKLQSLNVD